MKLAIASALLLVSFTAFADMGDSADAIEIGRVNRGEYGDSHVTPPPKSGEEITRERYCAERPERCPYEANGPVGGGGHAPKLVKSPAECSNAGDQVARPVYRDVGGKIVFAGFECVQDNRGSN